MGRDCFLEMLNGIAEALGLGFMGDMISTEAGAAYDQCASGGAASRRLLRGAPVTDERVAAALAGWVQAAAGLPALALPHA